jgi:hypothetical protein
MAGHIAGSSPGAVAGQLALLLRSSGDERADEIRIGVLRGHAERLAAIAGAQPGDDETVLRAQLVLCASIGVALLRSSGLQPLASAGPDDLVTPLRDLVDALLPPR